MCAVAVFVLFVGGGILFAQVPQAKKKSPMPDLEVKEINIIPEPKEGAVLNSVKILVLNEGTADAAANKMQISCMVAGCRPGGNCEAVSSKVRGIIDVPVIKKGTIAEITWVLPSSVKWVEGKYTILAEVDKYNAVKESDESDNIKRTLIHASSIQVDAAEKNK